MVMLTLPEINPAAPLLGAGEDLTSGLAYWYLAYPAIMAGTRWRSFGHATGLDSVGTLTNFTFPPSSTSGWSHRHGMHPGGYGAVCFNNGNNRMLFAGTGNLLTAGTPCTIAWWELINGTAQTFPARFNLIYNSGGTPSSLVIVRSNTTASALVWGPDAALAGVGAAIGTVSVETGKWNHVVMVATSGPDSVLASNWVVYKNGTVITPTTFVGTISNATADNRIGRSGANDQVNSALDDVAIWPTRALTPSEANNWYRQSANGHQQMLQYLSVPLFAPPADVGFGMLLNTDRNHLVRAA